jgi:myo-inositol 2-dehydrogenase/D-chiro-inositol 1-dehydrogenase
MDTIRIGFVGAGFIAGVHAGILARDPRVRVHAVLDPDLERVAAFALRTGARAVPALDDLLSDCDAIYICSPNAMHADVAVAALDAGLHVFSEKPMATSLEAASAVLDASKRARGVYQAGFNRRFASVYRELKHHIDAGDLTPASALLKMNRGELQKPAWTGDAAISGGFLYETPVHMLDLARHLFGEPVEVVCRARTSVYGQPDDFSMLLTFDGPLTSGDGRAPMHVTLTASAHATWLFPFERVEVYGDHAIAATEEMERITFATGVGQPAVTVEFAQQPLEERWGYLEEDGRFVDAMVGVSVPAVTAADAYGTTQLVDWCYRAARESQPPPAP